MYPVQRHAWPEIASRAWASVEGHIFVLMVIVVAAAEVAVAFVLAVPLKNLVLFDSFATSSWRGMSLARTTLDRIPGRAALLARITELGDAAPGNKILEVTGQDKILCDYPAEFKAQFRRVPLRVLVNRLIPIPPHQRLAPLLAQPFKRPVVVPAEVVNPDHAASLIRPMSCGGTLRIWNTPACAASTRR